MKTTDHFVFTSPDNLIHCRVTPTVGGLHLTLNISFNLSLSLCFMERLMLSESVQLVSHLGDYVSFSWISAAFALRWCKHFSQPSKLSLASDPGAVWGLRQPKPFSLTRPQNGCHSLACDGCAGDLAVLGPSFHCRAPAFYYPSEFCFLYGRIQLNDVNTYFIFSYLKCIFKARLDGALRSLI